MQRGNTAMAQTNGAEVVSSDLIARQLAAQIDQQIATANAYPRSVEAFKEELYSLGTADVETAQSCTYALPRGGKMITGPSVRMLELVVSSWGNLKVAKRSLEPEDKVVRGQAVVWDLQKNVCFDAEVSRRITDRRGRRYDDDMINIAANAAASIAFRNAAKACIPQAHWASVYEQIVEFAASDGREDTQFEDSRDRWIKFWERKGVPLERILRSLRLKSIDEMDMRTLETFTGLHTAMREGDIRTVLEAFPINDDAGSDDDADKPKLKRGRYGFGAGFAAKSNEAQKQERDQEDNGAQSTEEPEQAELKMPPEKSVVDDGDDGPGPWEKHMAENKEGD